MRLLGHLLLDTWLGLGAFLNHIEFDPWNRWRAHRGCVIGRGSAIRFGSRLGQIESWSRAGSGHDGRRLGSGHHLALGQGSLDAGTRIAIGSRGCDRAGCLAMGPRWRGRRGRCGRCLNGFRLRVIGKSALRGGGSRHVPILFPGFSEHARGVLAFLGGERPCGVLAVRFRVRTSVGRTALHDGRGRLGSFLGIGSEFFIGLGWRRAVRGHAHVGEFCRCGCGSFLEGFRRQLLGFDAHGTFTTLADDHFFPSRFRRREVLGRRSFCLEGRRHLHGQIGRCPMLEHGERWDGYGKQQHSRGSYREDSPASSRTPHGACPALIRMRIRTAPVFFHHRRCHSL